MKKLIVLLAALVLTVPSVKAFDFNFGIQAGVDFSTLRLKGNVLENFKSDNTPGFFIGPKINLGIALGLGVNVAAEYRYSKLKFESNAYDEFSSAYYPVTSNVAQHMLALPINLRYTLGISKVGVFVETGPEFNFMLSSNQFEINGGTFTKQNMTTFWNVGAGLKIWRIEAGATYNIGVDKIGNTVLSNIGLSNEEPPSMRQNAWQVHLVYYFR